jgi:phage head maturation protease
MTERATLSTAELNNLPDSAFAYIQPGGTKDAEGKTVPRSLRHFAIHDAAHVRNALARIGQGAQYGKEAMPKVMAAAKRFGISVGGQMNAVQHAPDIDVVRAMGVGPELRTERAGGDSLGRLVVRFSPFNTWYEVNSKWEGRFLERTVPGTFAGTVAADRGIMRSLFDHGHDPQIGNKVLGPIVDLREDPDSPVGEVDLLDTSYNRDLLPGLRAGVYGSSFRMHVTGEQWNDTPGRSAHNPDGIPERTITKTKTLEFGPVTFPASPTASASMRSMTDHFYEQLRRLDTGAYEAAARAAGLPTLRQMVGDADEDPVALAQAVDAALDAALDACGPSGDAGSMAPEVAQAYALMTAASASVDALLAALGATNPDDPGPGRSQSFTGRPARGAGGGDSTDKIRQRAADHDALRLRGIL